MTEPARAAAWFDRVASRYDGEVLRPLPFCADRLVDRLGIAPGWKVLDAATGTGAAAASAAQSVGAGGRVIGIDRSEAMLERAAARCHALAGEAGLEDPQVTVESLGYHLQGAERWWDLVRHSGLFGPPERLHPTLWALHRADVAACAGERGLWIDATTIVVLGRVRERRD